MSVFRDTDLPCPKCGKDVTFGLCHSINVDLRPDLREVILEGTFQRETCGSCGESFRMEPDFTYLDLGRKQWLAAKPADDLGEWQSTEAAVQDTYDRAFGAKATAAARRLGKGMLPRVVFGWSALTEKIAINRYGLDDVSVEIVKVGLVRNVGGQAFASDTELRFVFEEAGEDGPELVFNWYRGATGEGLQSIRMPKAIYDEIAGNPFDPLRPTLGAGVFVDMQRVYVPSV